MSSYSPWSFFAANVPVEVFLVAFHILHQSQLSTELWRSHIFITQRQHFHVHLRQPIPVPTFCSLAFCFPVHTGVELQPYWPPATSAQHLLPWWGPHCLVYNFPLCSLVSVFPFCIQHLLPQTLSLHHLFDFCVFVCFQAKAYNFQQVLS